MSRATRDPSALQAGPGVLPAARADRARSDFAAAGWCVLERAVDEPSLLAIERLAEGWAERREGPFELEAEVGYPGAPEPGAPAAGATTRRFLQVHQRDPLFRRLLVECGLTARLGELLGAPPILVLAHHNCLMTKQPRHSSDTPWHRDLRFWSFREGELISAWIALGDERPSRGGLWIVPGSHRLELPPGSFDERSALRTDEPAAAAAVRSARPVLLARGDVLLFHCRLLHSASRNLEATAKRSLVFTFRRPTDEPLPGTRSAQGGEVEL